MKLLLCLLISTNLFASFKKTEDDHDMRSMARFGEYKELENYLLNKKKTDNAVDVKMDLGMTYFYMAEPDKSNSYLDEALKQAGANDFSIMDSKKVLGYFQDEKNVYNFTQYEYISISLIKIVNFLGMEKLEDAVVEVKRLNRVLNYLGLDDTADMKGLYYLSAFVFEKASYVNINYVDDAIIDYQKCLKFYPNKAGIYEDLYRVAKRGKRKDIYEDIKKKQLFSTVRIGRIDDGGDEFAEFTLIYVGGLGPSIKNDSTYNIPYYAKGNVERPLMTINFEDKEQETSYELFNFSDFAISSLSSKYEKRVSGEGAKDFIKFLAYGVGTPIGLPLFMKSEENRYFLKKWELVPETLQICRIFNQTGKHKIAFAIPYKDSFFQDVMLMKNGTVGLVRTPR